MQYARKLRKGDKVAIVSLSSGMLGEEFCSHNIEIGVKRLIEYGLEQVFMKSLRTLPIGGGKGGSDFDPKC